MTNRSPRQLSSSSSASFSLAFSSLPRAAAGASGAAGGSAAFGESAASGGPAGPGTSRGPRRVQDARPSAPAPDAIRTWTPGPRLGLFDGEHPAEEIAGKLPERLEDLLTDTWYQKLRHPSGALLDVLRANDRTCDWKPGRGVRIALYSATGDRDVPIANTRSCARQLAGHGVRATVVDQGADADHYRAFLRSEPSIARALPVAR
ncbi:hypothetical protein ACFWJW_12645 [Streptomyces sp. NPDC127097]|uniref:hypothetical protein n=1 Tax=Streptomyces sp. NPDC127097 TaxID=3347136 RepID=UPI00365D2FAC